MEGPEPISVIGTVAPYDSVASIIVNATLKIEGNVNNEIKEHVIQPIDSTQLEILQAEKPPDRTIKKRPRGLALTQGIFM